MKLSNMDFLEKSLDEVVMLPLNMVFSIWCGGFSYSIYSSNEELYCILYSFLTLLEEFLD